MRLPFKGLYIFTQDFGANPQNYAQFLVLYPDGTRKPMKGHDGLDFGCPSRTEIIAPHDGVVIEATFDQAGYGWYVKLESAVEGSVIAHLDTIDAKVGYELKEGDHIGWSDNTGNSTGPHCHWGYYTIPRDRSNGIGGFIDQKPALANAGIHLTLGQLPEIDTVSVQSDTVPINTPAAATGGGDVANTYKGIDLTNMDSVKAAIDAWYDVANGKYKTAEDFQAVTTQFDTVKQQLEDTQKADENNLSDLKNYNEMKALGYNTVDDINKALAAKDSTNLDLQKENATIRGRNSGLAKMLSNIETEDHTAAELAGKTAEENTILKNGFIKLMQITSSDKFNVNTIIDRVSFYKEQTDKFIAHLDTENNKKAAAKALAKAQDTTPSLFAGLFKVLKLVPSGKGVS